MRKVRAPEGEPPAGPHQPVMLAEVLEALSPVAGARFVDGTFGAGGYSRGLLAAGASVLAIDRDPGVIPFAEALKVEFGGRFSFAPGIFSMLYSLSGDLPVDGVVLDIGVSSR